MTASVRVLAGPARTGKTERLLDAYRGVLAGTVPGRNLWIAPTHRSAADIRGRLLAGQLSACFSPGVVTFEGFAEAILQAADEDIRPIGNHLKRRLVRRLIERQRDTGRLAHFGPIADTSGLIELVCQWISELKRLEVWPDDYERACRRRGWTDRDRDLVAIYRAYQQVLLDHKLYDLEGRFWSARRLLRAGQRRPFERLELVVVDGFADFTSTQHEILQVLATRVNRLLVSLPLERESSRSDLFAKPARTLDRLKQCHPSLAVEWFDRATDALPTIRHIERQLFRSPHDVQTADRIENLAIVAAARQLGEIELLGRRIKRLIVGEGVPPGEIAVVFLSLADVGPLVREAFAELGIPVTIEGRQSLDVSPPLRIVVLLMRLHVEDWPFRQLLTVLTHNYFQPEWADRGSTAAADRLVRHLQVPFGRTELLSQAGRLAARAGAAGAGDEWAADGSVAAIGSQAALALPLLRRLAGMLDDLPTSATLSSWADALARLAEAAGVLRALGGAAVPHDQVADDRVAWQCLQTALRADDRLAEWLGDGPALLTAPAALERLIDVLRGEPLPGRSDETGRVRVLAAASVRALRIPILFAAGLAERAFPSPEQEGRLYGEAEYRSLIEAGLPLADRMQRHRDEMLLFYEVLTRAERSLTLSFPAFDQSAQPLSPSPFLTEVERVCGEGRIPRTNVPDLSPVPTAPEPLGPTDWRVKAVALAARGELGLLAGLVQREPVPGLADNVVAGLLLVEQRQRDSGFGAFEGVLSSPAIQHELATQFGPSTLWSASRLEQYARCPYQFFVERVLNLVPLEDISLQIDHALRGQLLHETLAAVHRQLNRNAAGPASPTDQPEADFRRQCTAVIDEVVSRWSRGSGLETTLREIDRRTLIHWLDGYVEQYRQYEQLSDALDGPPRPAHFEVRFGPDRHSSTVQEEPLSTDRPLAIDLGGEVVRIAGRVDRIDLGVAGGQAIFNVIDYKTGSVAGVRARDTAAVTALQLPLYVLATERLLLADRHVAAWRASYWFVRDKGYAKSTAHAIAEMEGGRVVATPDWKALCARVLEKVLAIVHGIRAARFPVVSVDEDCTSRCPFHTICRVNQVRALGKTWTQ